MNLPKFVFAMGVAPLLVAAQAPATQSVATPKTDASGPAKAGEIVCKKFESPTGTRIGKRQICRTRAEWDYIQGQEREAIEQALRKPLDV